MEQNRNQTRNRRRNRNRGQRHTIVEIPNAAEPGTTFLTPVPSAPISNIRFTQPQTRRRGNRNRQPQQNQNQQQQTQSPLSLSLRQQIQQQNQQQNQNQNQNQGRNRRRNRNRQRNQNQQQNNNAPVAQQQRNNNAPVAQQQRPLSIFWDLWNYSTFNGPPDEEVQNRIRQIIDNIQNNRYPDINNVDREGNTPLMIASILTDVDDGIIPAIIEHGNARIDYTNNDQESALILAAINGMEQNALYLVETRQANLGHRDEHGNDALFYARENDLYELRNRLEEILGTGDSDDNYSNESENDDNNQPIIPNYDPNRNLVREILRLRTNPENEARIIQEIQAGILNPGEVSTMFHNMTPLIIAIDLGFYNVAEKLIQTEINLDNVDDYGNTALILAAKNRVFDICDILIDKNANVGQINNDNENAMIFLLKEYANTHPNHYNSLHITQLLLKLAETKRADSGNASDLNGHNSVYYINNITDNNLKQRLKELIKDTPPTPFTELSTINKMRKIQNFENIFRTPAGPRNDQERISYQATIHNYKDNIRVSIVNNTFNINELTPTNKNTILMQAILTDAIRGTAIPILLINSGNSKPDAVNRAGKTALIMACENNLPEIALRLLNTGNANINQIDSQGHNALYYAQNAAVDFTQVINIIQPPAPAAAPNQQLNIPDTNININLTGFNSITQERETIRDFLASDNNNVVFVVNNEILFSNKNYIRTQLNNNTNNKYGCKQAGDQMRFQLDNNINFTPVYFSLSAIAPVQILVKKDEMESLLGNSNKLYICYSTNRILPAIMSVAYHQGTTSGVSADHCQTGKATHVYTLTPGNLVDIPIDEPEEEVEPVAQEEEQTVKVQYKGVTYTFPVTLETTLNNLKDMLLNKLVQENQIQNNNYNVKFIYTGKIYKQDNNPPYNFNATLQQLVSSSESPFGITIQSMLTPITGGKKRVSKRCKKYTKLTKQQKYIKQKKTLKRKYNK